jgi:glycosyltransferase involved in cell wall biosynthesis
MIPTYNRPHFLERTLRSVLEQDVGTENMQIEIIDNFSESADAAALVDEIGRGRVSFYRQPRHVSVSENFTTCVQRARGHWVHIMHDDDVLLPWFYATYKQFIDDHADVGMLWSRAVVINEEDEWQAVGHGGPERMTDGVLDDALFTLVTSNPVICPSVVISRAVYESVGGYNPTLLYAFDWEMWMRAAAHGGVGYIDRPSLLYRVHAGSGTNERSVSVPVMEDCLRAARMGASLLPPERRLQALELSRQNLSTYMLLLRKELHFKDQPRAGLRYAINAFKLERSRANIMHIVASALRVLKKAIKSRLERLVPAPNGGT